MEMPVVGHNGTQCSRFGFKGNMGRTGRDVERW